MSFSYRPILAKFHSKHLHVLRTNVLSNYLLQVVVPGRGLDIGTGDGIIPGLIMKKNKNVVIDGVDIENTEIKKRENIFLYDGKTLPFKDNEYDFVLLIDVLHHVKNPSELLKEVKRVSKKIIIVKDHLCENFFDYYRLKLMDWGGNSYRGIESYYQYFSSNEWNKLFEQQKLNLISKTNIGIYKFPISILAAKKLQVVFCLSK